MLDIYRFGLLLLSPSKHVLVRIQLDDTNYLKEFELPTSCITRQKVTELLIDSHYEPFHKERDLRLSGGSERPDARSDRTCLAPSVALIKQRPAVLLLGWAERLRACRLRQPSAALQDLYFLLLT